ncbi:MAG TPA: hypothetical protein VK797_23845 [Tepidisphaeraceae bacterium]|jgi:hypothetical protein|nr:hypothetical protein [Tepidisphaeraceae bacterium]
MSSAKKMRGRKLLEQRLLSYRRNPSYFETAHDGVSAMRRVEDHLRELDQLGISVNVDLPQCDRPAASAQVTAGNV